MPRSFSQLVRDFRISQRAMEKLVKDTPRIAGTEAKRVIRENFPLQSYDSGTGVTSWPPRSEKTNAAYDRNRGPGQQGNFKGSVYSSENPLLLQTRNLYNSIDYMASGNTVEVGSMRNLEIVQYAQAQNEGTDKGLPARQFMPHPNQGPNQKMLKAMFKKFDTIRGQALRVFRK